MILYNYYNLLFHHAILYFNIVYQPSKSNTIRFVTKSNMTGATTGANTAYQSRNPEHLCSSPFFQWCRIWQLLLLCVVLCRSLFVFLFFVFLLVIVLTVLLVIPYLSSKCFYLLLNIFRISMLIII